jgi:excisionase family DNA binding protein
MGATDVATSDSERTPTTTVRFLRVNEAARILRIGRSAAYEQANRWIATNGQCGLPAVKIGRMIRIPTAVLEAWAKTGSDAVPI